MGKLETSYQLWFEQVYGTNVAQYLSLTEAQRGYLKMLKRKKDEGYDVRLHLLSHTTRGLIESVQAFIETELEGSDIKIDTTIGPTWEDTAATFTKGEQIVQTVGVGTRAFVSMWGDSPSDVTAARDATDQGVETVAVATQTGPATFHELNQAVPQLLLRDLSDRKRIEAFLMNPR